MTERNLQTISPTSSNTRADPSLQTLIWLNVKIDLLRVPFQRQQGRHYVWFFTSLICKTALRSVEIWFGVLEWILSPASVRHGNEKPGKVECSPPPHFLWFSLTSPFSDIQHKPFTINKLPDSIIFYICVILVYSCCSSFEKKSFLLQALFWFLIYSQGFSMPIKCDPRPC